MPPKAKKVFKDLTFALSGNLTSPHKDLEEVIKQNGGDVASNVSQRVTHLISNKEEVKSNTAKIAKALKEEIPIVTEDFISDSIASGSLVEEERYTLREDDYRVEEVGYASQSDSDSGEFLEEEQEVEEDEKKRKKTTPTKAKKPKSPKIQSNDNNQDKDQPPKKKVKREGSQVKRAMINAEDFLKQAEDVKVKVAVGKTPVLFAASPKQFSSGSFGWGLAGKTLKLSVGNQEMTAQVTGSLVVRGSKPRKSKEESSGDIKSSQSLVSSHSLLSQSPSPSQSPTQNLDGDVDVGSEGEMEEESETGMGVEAQDADTYSQASSSSVLPDQSMPTAPIAPTSSWWNCVVQ